MIRALSIPLAVLTLVAGVPALAQVPAVSPSPAGSPSPFPSPVPSPTAALTAAPVALALAKTRLQLNPGGVSTIAVTGGLPPYAVTVAAAATAALATATIDPGTQMLDVRAAAPVAMGRRPPAGTTTLTVTDAAGASAAASLLVGPNAGFVPETVPLSLVGDPSQDFATVQIGAAIRRAASALPGAGVVVSPPSIPTAIPAGQIISVPVKVHIDGAGKYVDVDGISSVDITTAAAPPIVPTTLFYSDDPESVKDDGVLYRGMVTERRPARLYYYHQALAPGHQIAIVLDTPDGSAHVTVVGHGAGPNPAVMYVGQNATYRYLDDRARASGVALDIPVGAPVVLGAGETPLNVRDLVAGALDVGVTGAVPVRLTVVSYTPGVDDPRSLLAGVELPGDGYRRRGEYDLTKTSTIALSERLPSKAASPAAPQPEPTFVVASNASALQNLRPGGRALGGDYGLLHPVVLTLGNDGDAPGIVYLYEQPVTGYPVTTTIAFDGDPSPTRLQCVKTKTNRYAVRAFTVQPHATTTVTGSYMTDGGSTYPLVFGLTATPPSPPPQTMLEADGCFPKPLAASVATPAPNGAGESPAPNQPKT